MSKNITPSTTYTFALDPQPLTFRSHFARPSVAIAVALFAAAFFVWGYFEDKSVMWAGVAVVGVEFIVILAVKLTKEKVTPLSSSICVVTHNLGRDGDCSGKPWARGFNTSAIGETRRKLLNSAYPSYAPCHLMAFQETGETFSPEALQTIFPKRFQFLQNTVEVDSTKPPMEKDTVVGWDTTRFTKLGEGEITFLETVSATSHLRTKFVLLKDKSSNQKVLFASSHLESFRLVDKRDGRPTNEKVGDWQLEGILQCLSTVANQQNVDSIVIGMNANSDPSIYAERFSSLTQRGYQYSTTESELGPTFHDPGLNAPVQLDYVAVYSRRGTSLYMRVLHTFIPKYDDADYGYSDHNAVVNIFSTC